MLHNTLPPPFKMTKQCESKSDVTITIFSWLFPNQFLRRNWYFDIDIRTIIARVWLRERNPPFRIHRDCKLRRICSLFSRRQHDTESGFNFVQKNCLVSTCLPWKHFCRSNSSRFYVSLIMQVSNVAGEHSSVSIKMLFSIHLEDRETFCFAYRWLIPKSDQTLCDCVFGHWNH